MVSLTSLWLPILLSAVLVFIASSVIHMFLPHHRNDYAPVPGEDQVRDALRGAGVMPGEYVVPWASGMKAMSEPAYIEKRERGPNALISVLPSGNRSMTNQLVQWFIYCLVISIVAAYVASRAVGTGADYLDVFRFAGVTAFAGYALALPSYSIWFGRKWSTTIKSMIDGLVYAALTAGTFGWLWPSGLN